MMLKQKLMIKLIAPIGLLALAACSQEAGSSIDRGTFGNATMMNTQIMSGERSYVYSLAKRFSQEVPDVVTFAFDSAQLDAGARDTLRQQAAWIRAFPEVRFRVFGYADAPGTNAYNKRLGMRRAHAVVRFLTSQGIARSRLQAVTSFGETRLVINTQSRERRNRRAVTEVTGFVRTNKNVLDGKYAQIVYRDYVASGASPTVLTGKAGQGFKTD
jgi:outer membrane protein OmpA-like peptidoglycan-associated protein